MKGIVATVLLALACGGCAGFLLDLGLLLECGPMPMSFARCNPEPQKSPLPTPVLGTRG